jgi:hypothetical protein
MKTITLYDPVSGEFGPIVTASDEDIEQYLTQPHREGQFSSTSHMVDVTTGEIVPRTTAPPPLLHEVRNERNHLLDNYRWTVAPDSPLTVECQAQWLSYLNCLHRLLVDYPLGVGLVWPAKPSLEYRKAPAD